MRTSLIALAVLVGLSLFASSAHAWQCGYGGRGGYGGGYYGRYDAGFGYGRPSYYGAYRAYGGYAYPGYYGAYGYGGYGGYGCR
jgi:hypothetical protein